MNKKLLGLILAVTIANPLFAADSGAALGSAHRKVCCNELKKVAAKIAYQWPMKDKYTWEEAEECKDKAKFFGKHSLRVALRLVPALAIAAGVAFAVKTLTAKDSNNQVDTGTEEIA